MIEMPGIDAVRPGAYVFGDIALCDTTQAMNPDAAALTILATVVDRPAPGLALIDAGSKTFSGDKTALGWSGRALDERDLVVAKVNEEHGYIKGSNTSRDVDALQVGERVRFVPAHVCPAVNLFDRLLVIQDEQIVDEWPIEARGCVT
jgi:D-serine deaminase-like pyridoxal phosphate-dependent protein